MDRVYRLEGRVVHADGSPAGDVLVALVDDDVVFDDLLGVGATGADGAFRVAFTTAAFRQEPLEVESTPDLFAVLSVNLGGVLAPIHVARFADLALGDGPNDVGALTLPLREGWRALPHVAAAPGWRKPAKRLDIDEETVAHALREIGPVVERLTGWPGIVERTRVRSVESAALAMAPVVRATEGRELTWIERKAMDVLYGIGGMAGLYDPFERTVYLIEATLMRQNLDGLKVMLGHELVHAGQFQNHPELVDRYAEYVKTITRAFDADEKAPETTKPPSDEDDVLDPKLGPEARRAYQQCIGFMTNLEGYASYIENDFLRRTYVLSSPLPHLSLWGRMLVGILRPEGKQGSAGGTMSDKANEYEVGRKAYQKRQVGDAPARFEPAFDPTTEG